MHCVTEFCYIRIISILHFTNQITLKQCLAQKLNLIFKFSSIKRERERETEKDRERDRERQRDDREMTERDRETDREREREGEREIKLQLDHNFSNC